MASPRRLLLATKARAPPTRGGSESRQPGGRSRTGLMRPLPGFQIGSGAPGMSGAALTCSDQVCFETLQLQNMGPGCATNVDGNVNVFATPVSTTSLLASSTGAIRIPNNPTLLPGQVVSVNVSIPLPPPCGTSTSAVTL